MADKPRLDVRNPGVAVVFSGKLFYERLDFPEEILVVVIGREERLPVVFVAEFLDIDEIRKMERGSRLVDDKADD